MSAIEEQAPIRVELPGHGVFWFLEDDAGGGALAPFDHCDPDGHIADLGTALFVESYAHLFSDGVIRRYGAAIGHRDELRTLEAT